MKPAKTISRALIPALLIAVLVLPTGASKRAMADKSSKMYSRPATACQKDCCTDEEEYSIPVIKFFSWI